MAPTDAGRRFTALEAAGWSERAAAYDRLTGRVTAVLAGPLLDAAGVRDGMRVLDVGCGTGAVCALAAERGAAPTGVDVAPGMLAEARRRHPGLALAEADASSLPFADGAFDACVGNFVLNHLAEPEAAVAELVRVLAPGGAVALSLWDLPARNRWLGVVSEAIAEVAIPTPPEVADGPAPDRFADRGALLALLRGAGLAGVRVLRLSTVVRCADAGELWEGVLGGSVRASTTILRQPEPVRRRLREAVERRALRYRAPGGLELPARAVIGAGRVR